MARIISNVSGYLDRRGQHDITKIKSAPREDVMTKIGKALSMADKVVSSPALIGVAGLIKGGVEAAGKHNDDLMKQAAAARLKANQASQAPQGPSPIQDGPTPGVPDVPAPPTVAPGVVSSPAAPAGAPTAPLDMQPVMGADERRAQKEAAIFEKQDAADKAKVKQKMDKLKDSITKKGVTAQFAELLRRPRKEAVEYLNRYINAGNPETVKEAQFLMNSLQQYQHLVGEEPATPAGKTDKILGEEFDNALLVKQGLVDTGSRAPREIGEVREQMARRTGIGGDLLSQGEVVQPAGPTLEQQRYAGEVYQRAQMMKDAQAPIAPALTPVLAGDPEIPDVPVTTASIGPEQAATSGVAPAAAPAQVLGAPPAQAASQFDLNTPEGIYAAARLAKSPQQQALILQAASHVLRPERRRPTTIFEAFGMGGPTQPSASQMATVQRLFPKIATQSEKDMARAELYRAQAEKARANAKLYGQKTLTESGLRGSKNDLLIAKAYKARVTANAAWKRALDALKIAGKRRGRGGPSAAGKALKAAARGATAANNKLRANAERRHQELKSEERQLAKVKHPGLAPTPPTVTSRRRMAAYNKEKRKWEAANSSYTAAQNRLRAIPKEKQSLDEVVQETLDNNATILEDTKKGVEAVKKSLRRGSTTKGKKRPSKKKKKKGKPKGKPTAEDFLPD